MIGKTVDELSSRVKELEQHIVRVDEAIKTLAEELWNKMDYTDSITKASWPIHNENYLVENEFNYPVSFNGKMRFKINLSLKLSKKEIEQAVMKHDKTVNYLSGKQPKKVIIVPKRIINIVV